MKRILIALLSLLSGAAQARVRAYYTSRSDDLPAAVREQFRVAEARAAAGRPASIDIAVFSFTHLDIADELTRIIAAQPNVRVRAIFDLSQISHSEGHVGPYLEDLKNHDFAAACEIRMPGTTAAQRAACKADLLAKYGATTFANLEIKYKWYDAYVWSTDLNRPTLDHSRSLLMHRKLAIVDGDVLVGGSFNWSPQAADSNYENRIVLSGTAEKAVTSAYAAEFEGMWSNTDNFKSGPECRALRQVIWDRLKQEHAQ